MTDSASTTRAMLLIKSIEPRANLELSEWTGQWFVSANIEKSDGSLLTGITEHRDTPDQAVLAFLDHLQSVDQHAFNTVLVTREATHDGRIRHHWRWNGAAFAHEPVEIFAGAKNGS